MAQDVHVAARIGAMLADMADDIAPDELDEMAANSSQPMLTEWVLIANVADLETGNQGVVVLHEPRMLFSHVLGLLAMVDRIAGEVE